MKSVQLWRLISLKLQLIRQGVGVYIGDTGVYIAELSRTLTGVLLSRAEHEPFPREMEEATGAARLELLSETVTKCLRRAGIKPTSVYSSPSPAQVVTRYGPRLTKQEVEALLEKVSVS